MTEPLNGRLESVFVLHQHSVRAPEIYPSVHHDLCSFFYPRGAGFLTEKGIDASFKTAKLWSSWYPDHINGRDHSTVFVRSSRSSPCHETAEALLRSLFSTEDTASCPVPIYNPPRNYDKRVSFEGHTRALNETIVKHFSDKVNHYSDTRCKTLKDILTLARDDSGDPYATPFDVFTCLDGFISHIYENVPLPLFWMRNSDAFMATVNKCYWNIIEASGQLFGKHVLEAMASEMGMVFNKKLRCGYKWADYSYHDFTVSSVIKMLEGNVTQPRPNFLGAIFFELRTMRDGGNWVEAYYSPGLKADSSYSKPQPMGMTWNGGSHRMRFEEFQRIITYGPPKVDLLQKCIQMISSLFSHA